MTEREPGWMERIRQGVEAAGLALLDECRRTGQPLVKWRDGKVVYVDADGRVVGAPE